MADVSIRDLRNHGGEVVDRVRQGEPVTITRAGKPVAQLRPVPGPAVPAGVLVERRRDLPAVDLGAFRREIDEFLDADL